MIIDKATFLVTVGSLAVGSAGGYLAGERGVLRAAPPAGVTEEQPPPPHQAVETAPVSEPAAAAPVEPACDDSVGVAAACPPVGYPAEEGGCGALPAKRCQDFKQAMKPRVAERAVACLNALTPGQQCDPSRVSLCAHLALMNACPEPEPVATGAAPPDELAARCTAIERGCGVTAFGPSMRECRATMAGLNAAGREAMTTCMSTHCGDKGLVGCVGVVDRP